MNSSLLQDLENKEKIATTLYLYRKGIKVLSFTEISHGLADFLATAA